jgi:hypothetical protein
VVERILDTSKAEKKNPEIVIPQFKYRNDKTLVPIDDIRLIHMIYTSKKNVPRKIVTNKYQLGFANDDLVNEYLKLLSQLTNNVKSFTSHVFTDYILLQKCNGKPQDTDSKFPALLFRKNTHALFRPADYVFWKVSDKCPSKGKEIKDTFKDLRRKLYGFVKQKRLIRKINDNLIIMDSNDLKNAKLHLNAYYAFETLDAGTIYVQLQFKPYFVSKKVLFPVHQTRGYDHWTLLYLNFRHNQLEYYDSLPSEESNNFEEQVFKQTRQYVRVCFKKTYPFIKPKYFMKNLKDINYSQYDEQVIPVQEGVDCGFFVMELAKFISFGWKIDKDTPSAQNMCQVRKRCIFELWERCLLKV